MNYSGCYQPFYRTNAFPEGTIEIEIIKICRAICGSLGYQIEFHSNIVEYLIHYSNNGLAL